MNANKLVIGVTGMAGSGKSLVINVAQKIGYDVVTMGDEVREEARKRTLPPTPENLGKIMLELRQTEGETAIAKRSTLRIESATNSKIIVDGIRSLFEVEEFRKSYPDFCLIAIHASPETRFKRLFHRQRSDDTKDWKDFVKRDQRELGVGLGSAIAMAEYMIVNEEDLNKAKNKAAEILKKVEAKWTKQSSTSKPK
jgi:dephospho-CoA kinase